MTDLFEPLTPANPAAPVPRPCRRHASLKVHFATDPDGVDRQLWHVEQAHHGYVSPCEPGIICTRCWKRLDETAVRRGRTNRARGNSIEREVGKQLGLKRVGQFGGATDLGVSADPFAVSVKSGSGYFSNRYWDQLKRQPVAAGQTALLVVTDAPGAGHRRRAVVVLDLADWLALHGPSGVETVL
jgi:hypothetical protein